MNPTPRYLLMATHVPASGSLGGVVRYTVALARALARRDDIELHVLAAADALGFFTTFLPAERVHPVPRAPTAVHSLLERLGLAGALRTERFDVVHGTKHIVPRFARGAVRVLTVHDMLLLDRSGDFPRLKRTLLGAPYRGSIRQAEVLVAVSRATMARIVDHLPQVRERVGVVPLAASSTVTAAPAEPVAALAGRRFALVVGDAGPRKNLDLAVGTWDRVREKVPEAVLAVVGPKPWGVERHGGGTWDRLVADGALVQLRDVPDGALRWCYESAAAVLCPSLVEGFGLPTVEAAAFGTPVVTSDDPALCEASAGWGEPTAAWSRDDWVTTVAEVLNRTAPSSSPPPARDWDRIAAETVGLALGRIRPETSDITLADRVGVSPYRAGLRVLHVVAPGDRSAATAAGALAAAHRAKGWQVEVATDLPTDVPDTDVVALHGPAAGRLRARLRGRVPTVVFADAAGPRTPAAALRELRLARWTNALVLPAGASRRWNAVHAPPTRVGAPADPDDLAAVLVRARAWGPPAER
jgi:glycosyltransferase involved in cell wall biosynthesis